MTLVSMIGWVLVHSAWQAGLIAGLTAVVLLALRGAGAATRYWIAVAGMMSMVGAPIITVMVASATPTRGSELAGAGAAAARAPDTRGFVAAPRPADLNESPAQERLASVGAATGSATLRQKIERAFPWMVIAWLLGVVLFSLRTITGLVWARRLTNSGIRVVSDQVRGAAARIADSMGVRVAVRVLESSRVTVPLLVGWFRPVILIPGSLITGLMPQQLEAVLAHELAHVRRHDYAVNLLQTVVETLYFFHPAAWWLSGRIREERENACDELAVGACGGDRLFYSRVLLTVEESRGDAPALAVAATGGSLSRRIYRLLGAQPAHLDIGPRWYAGVFTFALVVVTAGGVMDGESGVVESHERWGVTADTGKAMPDTVIKFTGSAPLAERWQWALDQAKRHGYNRYWIGYLIDGDEQGQTWLHFDRLTPVAMEGGVMMGHMRFRGDFEGLRMAGVPLRKVIGEHEPYRVAVFMAYERGNLARLRLGSFAFPVHFGGAPVLWLGQAADAESVERLVRIDASTGDAELREDVTAAIGAHTDVGVVVPVLVKWAQDRNRPVDVREEAVEGLAHASTPEVLAVLARIARADDIENIRAEAVEAIGHLRVPAALDTLLVFARTLRSGQLQEEAVEALANLPDARGVAALREIIDDRSLGSKLRGSAVEELASHSKAPDILSALTRYTNQADDRYVRQQAVEAMGQVQADELERIKALVNVVERHPDPDIQARAAEAIGQVHAHEEAHAALLGIARAHPSEDVRRHAVEAIANFTDDDRGARLLLEIARTHPSQATQRDAVESMGNFHHFPIFKDVAAIAFSGSAVAVRRTAVETYMPAVPTEDALAFARRLLASDAPFDVRREVVEALADLDGGAGIPVIIEIARTAPDAEIRKLALEALIDSEDPRAVAALRRVQ